MNWINPFHKRGKHSKRPDVPDWAIPAAVFAILGVISALGLYSVHEHHGKVRADETAAASQAQAKKAQAQRADADSKRAALAADLASKQAALDNLNARLLSSEGNAKLQAANVATLRTCLDGVTLALVQVANNDVATAQQTLAGVQEQCKTAEALL